MKQYDVKISYAALSDMEQIYSYIADRLLEPDTAMGQRVRICDIAEELGLSTATVSNVIHGKTNKVSDATVQRVMALLERRQ